MKNTVLKFNTREENIKIDGDVFKNAPDYFSKSIKLHELTKEFNDMLTIYKIQNNDKLERISYEIYGTTDYWDILLLLNNRDPLFEMPYDDDFIENSSTEFVNFYRNYVYFNSPLMQKRTDELYREFSEKFKENNEKYRYIKIVKPSKINDFISFLKKNKFM